MGFSPVVTAVITPNTKPQGDFPMYDGKRMAVVLSVPGNTRVMTGRVRSDTDRVLGPVLRVELEHAGDGSSGQTTLILPPELLQGRLAVDHRYGCDWCLDLRRTPGPYKDRHVDDRQKTTQGAVVSV